ncbi:MerC domain-containing protein [Sphingomonas sp. 1P06PA]|uniref:MerC domain-containing protein n=1 Tax=Sphingomonas sp. 1P06PA TaxID=554121 RepID=UPI0039A61A11
MDDIAPRTIIPGRLSLDRLAIGLSALCLVHCLTTAVLVIALSSVGGWLVHPAIHEIGLLIAVLFAAVALGQGMLRHGYMLPAAIGGLGIGVMAGAASVPHGPMETVYTILGVAIVALGHDLNRRALI